MAPPPKKETPYPEKQSYKIKNIKVDTAAYAEGLSNAYKTTRDIAAQLKEEIEPFIKKAKARVNILIDIIQGLRKEIREARMALTASNKDHLYPSIMAIVEAEDPYYWKQDEEFKEAT